MQTSQAGDNKDFLEWNGDAYHRLSDLQYKAAMKLLDTLKLKGNETLLDAGCGSGRITKVLLARLPKGRIIGADLSDSMLATARRACVAGSGQSVEFVHADLQTYVTPRLVDGIFSNMALHFVHDHARMYRNFAKSLRAGGFLALQFGTAQSAGDSATNLLHVMNEPPFEEYLRARVFDFKGCDAQSTGRLLQEAGFVDIEVQAIQAAMHEPDRDKMVEFMNTTVVPEAHRLLPTQSLRDAFDARFDAGLGLMFRQGFEYLRVRANLPR